MSKTTSDINELIELLNDGVTFYEDAAEASPHQQLYRRMASSKRAIVSELRTVVASYGETPAEGGTVSGTLRRTYTDLRARISSDPESEYVSQLEETEDNILRGFLNSQTDSENVAVREIAQRYLPEIRRMHNEIRELKLQLRAA